MPHAPADRRMRWRDYRQTAIFVFCMLVFRSAWADWVTVPTGSMNPTIIEGDRVLVDKHVFGVRVPWTLTRISDGRDPRRGEIVVFDSPTDGISLVKRVIGEPGDVVAWDDSGLMIDGVRADYAAGDVARLADVPAPTLALGPVLVRESGVVPSHDVMRLPIRTAPGFGPVRVPPDTYLMLGDSRDNSADSRYFGFVPRRNIVGLASRVAVSFDPANYYLPRGKRWFMKLDREAAPFPR